jgi:DNA-directed RNA polymerase sigma subunit (sigma70/sigma32)
MNPLMASSPDQEPGEERSDDRRVEELAAAARREHQLDPTEHARLVEAAGRGDQQARDSLTSAHLDWVLSAARERADRGLSQSDLFQEGTIGLMEAIEGFPRSGRTDFEAFVREQVGRHMDQALGAEQKAVEDSRMLVQAAHDYEEAEVSARRELGRPPTNLELAAKLEWSIRRTEEIGLMVADARHRHDEEIVQYLELDDIDLDAFGNDQNGTDGS